MSAAAVDQHITCEVDGAFLIVTLNRPEKLNAYTGQMGAEITQAFERADKDDSIRAVIVTGAGRAFCAGADVSGGATSFDTSGRHGAGVFAAPKAGGSRFVEAIFNCRKPSIAAINGAAVGVGITMTLPMDIRIAAKGAKIGFIFARRGLVPEAGSAWFLPKLVGLPQSLRWREPSRPTARPDSAAWTGIYSRSAITPGSVGRRPQLFPRLLAGGAGRTLRAGQTRLQPPPAIVAAANLAWPPRTIGLRILDGEGREVFAREKSDRRAGTPTRRHTTGSFSTPLKI